MVHITCWGTRGSLPTATNQHQFLALLDDLVKEGKRKNINDLDGFLQSAKDGQLRDPISFGGNTSCTEFSTPTQSVFVDMGSGLREAGSAALKEGRTEFHIMMSHMHWDHIMGMPFFVPVYMPGMKIHIYHMHKNGPEMIKVNFNGSNFPLKWDQLSADIEFHQLKLYQEVNIGDLNVTPFSLDHPGGSFGFRFEHGGISAAIGVDGEYKRLTPKELGKDLPYYQNLDLLIFDAQYEMAELASKFDWGHCSPNIGVDLALREQIKRLVFTHHDPWADAAKLRKMYSNAEKYLKSQLPVHKDRWSDQVSGPELFMAYDSLKIELKKQ